MSNCVLYIDSLHINLYNTNSDKEPSEGHMFTDFLKS